MSFGPLDVRRFIFFLVFLGSVSACRQTYSDPYSDLRGALAHRFMALEYYKQEKGVYPKSINDPGLKVYLSGNDFGEFRVKKFLIKTEYTPSPNIILRFEVRDVEKGILLWIIEYNYEGARKWRRAEEWDAG